MNRVTASLFENNAIIVVWITGLRTAEVQRASQSSPRDCKVAVTYESISTAAYGANIITTDPPRFTGEEIRLREVKPPVLGLTFEKRQILFCLILNLRL